MLQIAYRGAAPDRQQEVPPDRGGEATGRLRNISSYVASNFCRSILCTWLVCYQPKPKGYKMLLIPERYLPLFTIQGNVTLHTEAQLDPMFLKALACARGWQSIRRDAHTEAVLPTCGKAPAAGWHAAWGILAQQANSCNAIGTQAMHHAKQMLISMYLLDVKHGVQTY